jgi:hypothetical protein
MPIIEVILRPGQSLTDLALERYGAIEGLGVILNEICRLSVSLIAKNFSTVCNTFGILLGHLR